MPNAPEHLFTPFVGIVGHITYPHHSSTDILTPGFSSVTWTDIHWPLCCALILVSAALSRLTPSGEVNSGVRWFFGGGLGCALVCLTVIGITHKSLDPQGSSVLSRVSLLVFSLN
jgi:hypothetical protein